MVEYLERTRIDVGADPLYCGHVVYSDATYSSPSGDIYRIVYKENKQGNPDLSRFEAAFGELARVFMMPGLTPQQYLVKAADQRILGVASEYVGHTIATSEGLNRMYYSVRPKAKGIKCKLVQASEESDIPFYFLQQFPPGFFKKLCTAAHQGKISLDLHSLANVLGTSYSLEEDDLHKGNFGFYIIEKDGKPHVMFFKIDHDLMLADSVMSHCQSRFFNWLNSADAFAITQRDLLNFPKLLDSQNYYWPTIKRIFGLNKKIAYNQEECDAFAELAQSEEFCQYKWEVLYKHVLIPPEITQQALSKHLDESDPVERAKISLITQSVLARQAKLRAVLFSMPEFRQFMQQMAPEVKERLLESVTHTASTQSRDRISLEVLATIKHQQMLCQPGAGFEEGDTPLHAAIRLGDYRYHETWSAFGHFARQENEKGQTALDVAAALGQNQPFLAEESDGRINPFSIMKHLLNQGVIKTTFYQQTEVHEQVKRHDYRYNLEYVERVKSAGSYQQFKEIIRDLGEDHRFCLKMQKEISIACLCQFIAINRKDPNLKRILEKFKKDLNAPSPELQFVQQLRSQLWIVRIIRGLFGWTSTQAEMNKILDKTISQLTPKSLSGCFSFFCGSSEKVEDPRVISSHVPEIFT